MAKVPILDYFMAFATGKLKRETLAARIPYPVLILNPSASETHELGTSTARIEDAQQVLVYSPTHPVNREGHSGFHVGRSEDAEFSLDDAEASRRHAFIWQVQGDWRIADLGSQNGTRLFDFIKNAKSSAPRFPDSAPLGASASIRLGKRWYNFQTPERFLALIRRKATKAGEASGPTTL